MEENQTPQESKLEEPLPLENENPPVNNISQIIDSLISIQDLLKKIPKTEENELTLAQIETILLENCNKLRTIKIERNKEDNRDYKPELKTESTSSLPKMNKESADSDKMDLVLSKIDIIIKMMREGHKGEEASDEFYDKVYPNGDKYIGPLVNDKKEGRGKMFYANKDKYDGQWKNDLKEGEGELTLSNGDRYVGQFVKGLMEGKGIYYFKNGRKYEGDFKNNVMEGNGKYYFTSGNEYHGELKNGVFNGKATFLYKNGDKYEGEYKGGKKSGPGVYYYKSGEKYLGEWKKDERNGEGILVHKNGEEEKQTFDMGKLIKKKKK